MDRTSLVVAALVCGPVAVDAQARRCSNVFAKPSPPPEHITSYLGIQMEDVCISGPSPHRAFVIGDWGGIVYIKDTHPVPADKRSKLFPMFHREFVWGVDDKAQVKVAEVMEQAAAVVHPDYILNVGDNFYWGGIDGKCGEGPMSGFSEQWQHVFEEVYSGPHLKHVPWLGVLGNHDYGGYMFTSRWAENIGYTWADSHRWLQPSLYWAQNIFYDDFSVAYVFVDSNAVEAWVPNVNVNHNLCSNTHNNAAATCGDEGPPNIQECHRWFWELWYLQWPWLMSKLQAANEHTWQVLVTHYPPKMFQHTWQCLSDKYGIDLFVSGHIHHQRVYAQDDHDNFLTGGTCTIVSGGGGGITSEGIPSVSGEDDQYGFMNLKLSASDIVVQAISHGGVLRSETVCRPRRALGGVDCDNAYGTGRRLDPLVEIERMKNMTFV